MTIGTPGFISLSPRTGHWPCSVGQEWQRKPGDEDTELERKPPLPCCTAQSKPIGTMEAGPMASLAALDQFGTLRFKHDLNTLGLRRLLFRPIVWTYCLDTYCWRRLLLALQRGPGSGCVEC